LVDSEKKTISKQIDTLNDKSKKLQQNEVKINEILSQFDHMGSMLIDVEKRVNQLTLAQNKLNKMEGTIMDLSSQADVRIEDLSTLTKKIDTFFGVDSPTSSSKKSTGTATATKKKTVSNNTEKRLNEQIFKMYDTGMDISQISKIVKRPISDIELRLHVRKD